MTASTAKQPAAPSPELITQIQQGLNYQKNKEMDQAEAIFSKAVAENPDNPDVLQIAAIFYDQVENYKKSQELLEKVIVSKANDASVKKLLGKALLLNGDYKKAEAYLEAAIADSMEDAETWLYFAECKLQAGLYRNAENLFTKSLEKSHTISALNRYMISLILQDQHHLTVEMLEKALEQNIYDYETIILLAIAYKTNTAKVLPLLEQIDLPEAHAYKHYVEDISKAHSEKDSSAIKIAADNIISKLLKKINYTPRVE